MTNNIIKRTRPIREVSALLSDCYKFGHRLLYPEGTTYVYSTLTPRDNTYFPWANTMTVFGYEMFVQRWLVEHFNENFFFLPKAEVLEDYEYVVGSALGKANASSEHIGALHDLGYLPILIKALPEGIQVNMKVPVLTIENTNDEFYWLTNFLETLLISETFVTSTVASMARQLKDVCNYYADETADSRDHILFQCHDFSERGQHGNQASQLSGVAHLTSFVGSDTIQSGIMAHNYYSADLANELVLASVLASEHSVMQAYGKDEVNTFKTLIEKFPEGILSLVSDTYDYYGVVADILTLPEIREAVLARNGKVVIRPDSGNPADIIAGQEIIEVGNNPYEVEAFHKFVESGEIEEASTYLEEVLPGKVSEDEEEATCVIRVGAHLYEVDYKVYGLPGEDPEIAVYDVVATEETPEIKGTLQLMWETYGGHTNSKGFKVLDPHIGLLYGEGITVETAGVIFNRMMDKGFSSENVVFGVGAYVYSVAVSRDSFGQAVKSQLVTINGENKMIFKDPKTDTKHLKRSLKGKVGVTQEEGYLKAHDGFDRGVDIEGDLLETIFENGERKRFTSLATIRKRIDESLD